MKSRLYTLHSVRINEINKKAVKIYQDKLNLIRLSYAKAYSDAKKIGDEYARTRLSGSISALRESIKNELSKKTTVSELRRTFLGNTIAVRVHSGSELKEALEEIKQSIRNRRARLKHEDKDYLAERPINYHLKESFKRRLHSPKKPADASQYVGIEIECITPADADLSALLPFVKYVDVGSDGSIEHGSGENGTEIRVCLKREEVREILPQILDAIKKVGGRVNRSCGLHVHLDQRGKAQPELDYQKLVRSLGLLFTVVPKSRRKNRYCRKNRNADFATAQHGDRYYAINATAFHRYGTIEVRLFGGTLEAEKIINWIETLHAITSGDIVLRCPKTFDTALKYWKLSPENLAWLKARQEKFGSLNIVGTESESDSETEVLQELENVGV